jgi:tetratricopeptide (TPR) repeat protein
VLVLQNQRLRTLPAWHYAVVIGADPATEELILRSGPERRLLLPAARFMRSWDLAERWALVLLSPGDLPAKPDKDRYFTAVAGLEAAGRHADAARAWQAALVAWPGDDVAQFGFATASQLAGDLATAYAAYAELIGRMPGHAAALNNLAHLLADSGCPVAARVVAQRAVAAAAPGSTLAAAANGTLRQLQAETADASVCRLP